MLCFGPSLWYDAEKVVWLKIDPIVIKSWMTKIVKGMILIYRSASTLQLDSYYFINEESEESQISFCSIR